MSIRSYFVPKLWDLPDLEKVVSSSTAEAVKKEVCSFLKEPSGSANSGADENVRPAKKAKIARYAAENDIAAAIRHLRQKKVFPELT